MSRKLEFRKGGILFIHEWVYDESKGAGQYVERDVTDYWLSVRDLPCKLGPGVTLMDVFLFIDRYPELCDIIFCNSFAKKMHENWKKVSNQTRLQRPSDHYDPDGIEFLELYWNPEISKWDNEAVLFGDDRASCDGIGYELREDKYETYKDTPVWFKGQRIKWSIGFSPLASLLDLPIRLNEKYEILDDWEKYKGDIRNVPKLVSCVKKFSFEQIIEGLLWELSFYGDEDEKAKKKSELDEIVLDLTKNDQQCYYRSMMNIKKDF